ncbi:MAG: adenosylcobinamide-GDP ribazoletransferase [Candidatus Nanopelagicales bacterium]|nr:adenosylcobinamide-GDP ribazoletransferase [Candidatus Nanopelagicales bacterium]
MPDALRLAIGTFTRLPVAPPRLITRATAGQAMALAPAIGVVLALVCGLPLLLAGGLLRQLLLATICVALLAWVTRALHLDGLADTADALGSGRPADQALAIARRSDIGPFGVVALVLALLLQVIALAACADGMRGLLALIAAVLTSRVALTWSCIRAWPAARPDGLGATVAGSLPLVVPILWSVVLAILATAFLGIAGGIAAALGVAAAILVLVVCRRRLGGVTGDVLGAVIEVSMTVALVALALAN